MSETATETATNASDVRVAREQTAMNRIRAMVRRVTRGTPGSCMSTGFWPATSMAFGVSMCNVFITSLITVQQGYVPAETLYESLSWIDLDMIPIAGACALASAGIGALWSGIVQILSHKVKAIGDFNRGYHRTSRYAPRLVWYPVYAAGAFAFFSQVRYHHFCPLSNANVDQLSLFSCRLKMALFFWQCAKCLAICYGDNKCRVVASYCWPVFTVSDTLCKAWRKRT